MIMSLKLKIQMKRVAQHLVYIWGHLCCIPRFPLNSLETSKHGMS